MIIDVIIPNPTNKPDWLSSLPHLIEEIPTASALARRVGCTTTVVETMLDMDPSGQIHVVFDDKDETDWDGYYELLLALCGHDPEDVAKIDELRSFVNLRFVLPGERYYPSSIARRWRTTVERREQHPIISVARRIMRRRTAWEVR